MWLLPLMRDRLVGGSNLCRAAYPVSEELETRKENDMRKYLGYGILAVAASTVAVTAAHAFSYWWYVASYGYGG